MYRHAIPLGCNSFRFLPSFGCARLCYALSHGISSGARAPRSDRPDPDPRPVGAKQHLLNKNRSWPSLESEKVARARASSPCRSTFGEDVCEGSPGNITVRLLAESCTGSLRAETTHSRTKMLSHDSCGKHNVRKRWGSTSVDLERSTSVSSWGLRETPSLDSSPLSFLLCRNPCEFRCGMHHVLQTPGSHSKSEICPNPKRVVRLCGRVSFRPSLPQHRRDCCNSAP